MDDPRPCRRGQSEAASGKLERMDTTTQSSNRPTKVTSTEPPADRVRIVSTPDVRGGKPRIAGHRITVADIAVWHERQGMSPDEIVDSYSSITLSDVYAALAYYFENRERIDADIREGEQRAEELRAGQPSIFEKVRQRTDSDAKDDPLPPG
jgi:uncharacterized protein (DUF433 family)